MPVILKILGTSQARMKLNPAKKTAGRSKWRCYGRMKNTYEGRESAALWKTAAS
jgi:hypothetical protein